MFGDQEDERGQIVKRYVVKREALAIGLPPRQYKGGQVRL
jgi:hypothetical protein